MKSVFCIIFYVCVFSVFPFPATAGILDDFEHDSTTRRSDNRHSSPSSQDSEESISDELFWNPLIDGIYQTIVQGTAEFFSYGTRATLDRTSQRPKTTDVTEREIGSPLLPMFRVSGSWQYIDSKIKGRDFFLDTGKSLFSVQFRRTAYREYDPRDGLSLSYGHVKYRLSYGNSVELDLGLGRAELNGNKQTWGGSFTAPLFWKFRNHFGFGLWQAVSNFKGVVVYDQDFSCMYFNNGFSVSAGYRSISNPVSSLSGPYLGLSYIY